MKILFVYTDINVRGGARSYQFGIGSLSAVLKQRGHSTRLHYMYGRYDPAPLKAKLEAWQPDLVAFSAVSPQFPYVRRILEDCRPFRAFTLLGGQHATLAPECLESLPALNALCVGEGEAPVLELAEALQAGKPPDAIRGLWLRKPDGAILRNPTRPFIENLDALPFVDRELFDYQAIVDSDFNTALFMFSRGCPYNCTFCSNHALRVKQAGRYVRFRGVESCLAEIREVTGRYRVRALYFNDDCFTARRGFVEEFCPRYQEEFSLPFDINARPETLDDDLCRRLKEAGCRRVSIGIESGSESFRREVLGRNTTNAQIVRAFESCRRAGLKTKSFNIVGFPGETPAIFQETVDLNARIQPDSVIIGIFEPYPGTKLAEVCLQQGFLAPGRADNPFMGRTDTVLKMPQFPRRAILRCFRNFAFNVYKKHAFRKALFLRVYYSRYGELLLRLLAPFRNLLRRATMGV